MLVKKTNSRTKQMMDMQNKIDVSTEELQLLLSCGRKTAIKIGHSAEARIDWGKRVLWNVNRVKGYMDEISE